MTNNPLIIDDKFLEWLETQVHASNLRVDRVRGGSERK